LIFVVVGYTYLIGVVLFYNSFGFFMNPEVFRPWFLNGSEGSPAVVGISEASNTR
jgi:hypothetical protein